MSVDREYILRLYAYHHWADDLLFDALSSITAAQLDKPWGGSFGNGRALLEHIVGVERMWCERFNGTSPKGLPKFAASHGGADFRAEWQKAKADQQRFLSALTRERVSAPLTYTNIEGKQRTYPLADLMMHVTNHGTYHRGQVSHLLRDLGARPPSTDFLFFLEAEKSR